MTAAEDLIVDITGRHDHISDRMRSHAIKKLQKLGRYNDRVRRVELVADHAHEMPELELIVHMSRGKPLVAKLQGDTFSATVDVLVEKMERQLKKQKEKRKDHKGRDAKAAVRRKAPRGGEETYEEVVRKSLRG